MITTNESHSLGDLVRGLKDDASRLVQQEVELVKTEMKQKAKRVGKDSVMLIAGVVIAWFSAMALVGALCAAAIALLQLAMPMMVAVWLGPLLIALILGAAGGGLLVMGKEKLQQHDLKPTQTMRSLEEDKQWIREKITT